MDAKIAGKILEDWDDACKELKIPHFLIYGTCLGFHREGGFIRNDSDIDTRVICNKEKWKELVKLLGTKGIKQSGNPKGWAFWRSGTLLCIERSEKVGTIIQGDGTEYPVLPLYHKFDVCEYEGRKYNMPHPVEEYLESRYGNDWRVPNPNWDKKKDALGA